MQFSGLFFLTAILAPAVMGAPSASDELSIVAPSKIPELAALYDTVFPGTLEVFNAMSTGDNVKRSSLQKRACKYGSHLNCVTMCSKLG